MITPEIAQRLRQERIVWITTVTAGGQPQTAPVWYLWDGHEFIIWSFDGVRVRNLSTNPKVNLHLNDDGRGDNIVIVEGIATIDRSLGPGSANPAFVNRYQELLDAMKHTWDWFDRDYPVPVRVKPTRVRAW
jgi:PPOX class probable F420-dependent enzyme